MCRTLLAGFLALAGLALPAAPAFATFHLEKVNEVLLASTAGDAGTQFVELLDTGGSEEQFTPLFAPYKLVVFDGAGNMLGEQTLDPTGLRSAASSGSEYLISTAAADAAFGVTGNAPLTIPLPLDAAQVCFQGSPGNVSCLSYGSISKPVSMSSQGTGAAHGPVPSNGGSDQRQSDNSIQAATPTPKTANHSGTPTGAGGSPHPFAGTKLASHKATVDAHGRAHVSLSCPTQAIQRCRGDLTLLAGSRRVGHAAFSLRTGARGVSKVTLSRAARRTLAQRHRLTVRAVVAATDGAGRRKTNKEYVTLVR